MAVGDVNRSHLDLGQAGGRQRIAQRDLVFGGHEGLLHLQAVAQADLLHVDAAARPAKRCWVRSLHHSFAAQQRNLLGIEPHFCQHGIGVITQVRCTAANGARRGRGLGTMPGTSTL